MSEAEAATSAGVPQNDDALPPSTSAEEVQQSNSGDVKNDNNNDDNGDDDTEQSKPLTTLGKKSSKKKSKPDTEVLYSTGATALFLAVEDCRWRDALDISELHPSQIPIWVKFTGSENSALDFNSWRRLPIHEACRRQAPAWLISAFLSANPEMAQKMTQFDQLPLHIAVEFGAAPEVVNLLVVAYWDAIVAQDQSGRTPVELLDTSELLQQEEYRVVYESLSRCHTAYTNFQKAAAEEQNAIKRKHKATFAAVSKKHAEDLKRERDIQNDLKNEIQALQDMIISLQREIKSRDVTIDDMKAEQKAAALNEQRLKAYIADLNKDVAREKHHVALLLNTVEDKDAEIQRRDDRIQLLSGDLQAVLLMQEQDVAASLTKTERTMRAMVSSQIALQKELLGQADCLRELLEDRGIPAIAPSPVEADERQEEKESSFNVEVDPNQEAAVVAAAAAALQKSRMS